MQALWDGAVATLIALGATVQEIEWPFVHNYRRDTPAGVANGYSSLGLSDEQFTQQWQWTDAYYFNEHLKVYGYRRVPDVLSLPSPTRRQDPDGFDKIGGYKQAVRDGVARSYADYGFDAYFAAYRQWARRDVEQVMIDAGADLLAFPVTGTDDPDDERYEYLNALAEGTFLGLPQLSVPMGIAPSGRPQGMMLMARTYYTEAEILGVVYAFEQATHAASACEHAPAPGRDDRVHAVAAHTARRGRSTRDDPASAAPGGRRWAISGTATDASALATVHVYVNGALVHETTDASRRVSARVGGRLRDALAMVVAKDVHGNAAATMRPLR